MGYLEEWKGHDADGEFNAVEFARGAGRRYAQDTWNTNPFEGFAIYNAFRDFWSNARYLPDPDKPLPIEPPKGTAEGQRVNAVWRSFAEEYAECVAEHLQLCAEDLDSAEE